MTIDLRNARGGAEPAIERAYRYYVQNGWPNGAYQIYVPKDVEVSFRDVQFNSWKKPEFECFTQVQLLEYASAELQLARGMAHRVRCGHSNSAADKAGWTELGEMTKGALEAWKAARQRLSEWIRDDQQQPD